MGAPLWPSSAMSQVDMFWRATRPQGVTERGVGTLQKVWRGLAGEPGVSGQGTREKEIWNFPEWGREVGELVLERRDKRREELAGRQCVQCEGHSYLCFSPHQDTPSLSQI